MTKCYAKDPSKCRYHGVNFKTPEEAVESLADSIFSEFEKAMARKSPTYAKQQVVIELNRKLTEELEERYAFIKPPIEEEFAPLESGDERLDEFNQSFHNVNAVLSEDEKKAVYEYAGITYSPLNQMLYDPDNFRTRYKTEEDYQRQKRRLQKQVSLLDSAIAKVREPEEPRVLYRVIHQDMKSDDVVSLQSSEDYAASLGYVEGNVVESKGFLSTTIDPGYVNGKLSHNNQHVDVVVVLSSRKGIPVSETVLDNASSQNIQDREREILLPRGGKYRITKIARTRFQPRTEWDEAIEPLTVYLEEV